MAALRRGLQALPAADHDVLMLQYVQGLSAADAYYEVTYTSELAETAYRIIQNMD